MSGEHKINGNLVQLVEKLKLSFSDRLVAVILYGSGASGDHDANFSDLNVLCVLKQITPRELSEGEPVIRWWRAHGHPSPLLMTEEEAHNSADSFPIEFRDMQEHRKVLYGVDVIAGLEVSGRYHRVQVEHELRAKLFRLRQQGAGVLSDSEALVRLCADSVSTFCVLGRHALLTAGVRAETDRRGLVAHFGKTFGMDTGAFDTLLDIREKKLDSISGDAQELFAKYLESVQKMIEFVDGQEEK